MIFERPRTDEEMTAVLACTQAAIETKRARKAVTVATCANPRRDGNGGGGHGSAFSSANVRA